VEAAEGKDAHDHLTAGRGLNELVPSATSPREDGTVAPGTSGGSEKFRVLDVAALVASEPPPVPWQVEQFAVRGDVTVTTGDPGAGKSLLTLTLAGAVARGESVAGIDCEKGSALYIDAENGQREIHRRLHSLGVAPTGITVAEADGADLRVEDDFAAFDALVGRFTPALVVLDSLTALWPGANERKTEDVAPTLYALKRLAERHGAAVVVLHHRPKAGGEYRGTTAIAAAAQLGFTLSKVDGDPDRTRRRLSCWKCRPAAEPEDRWLHLDAEKGMVLVGQAEPYEDPDAPERPKAPAQARLTPRFLEALGHDRLSLSEIAGQLGINPKDGTLRRVAESLEEGGEIAREADKRYERCQVPGASAPRGSGTVAPGTPALNGDSGAELRPVDELLREGL